MSNLTDLVPPLELCKLIPQGEFEDSLALWVFFPKSDKKFHLYLREDLDWSKTENYPAPTMQELLAVLNEQETWHIQGSLHFCNKTRKHKTPTGDLLKAFLINRGILQIKDFYYNTYK